MADKIEWHPNGTPGPFVIESDSFEGDHAVVVALPGRAGQLGVSVARCEHNWKEAHKGERRISWKEAETNARMFREGPAMVQALRDVVDVFGWQSPNANPAVNTAVASARAILARIDGEG